jgi:hypothetical protein
MSYQRMRSQPKKPPANPIVVGCFGTVYLAFLYVLGYGIITALGQRYKEFTPEYLYSTLEVPSSVSATILGQLVRVPIPVQAVLFVEITLVVMLLLGLTSMLYSYYHQATREKEGWELYAEEAERQARMAKGRGGK